MVKFIPCTKNQTSAQGGEEMPNIYTKQHFQKFIPCTHTKIIIHFLGFNKPKKLEKCH